MEEKFKRIGRNIKGMEGGAKWEKGRGEHKGYGREPKGDEGGIEFRLKIEE